MGSKLVFTFLKICLKPYLTSGTIKKFMYGKINIKYLEISKVISQKNGIMQISK